MTGKVGINGETHLDTATAAKKLKITPKRVLDYIAQGRIEAVYLNGYYIPEAELEKLQQRKPGRPAGKARKPTKSTKSTESS